MKHCYSLLLVCQMFVIMNLVVVVNLALFEQFDIVAHFLFLISSRYLIDVEPSVCCVANKLKADGLKVRYNIENKKGS